MLGTHVAEIILASGHQATLKGRTYKSKRSDQKYLQKHLQAGAVHI